MRSKLINTPNNKFIKVYYDLFSFVERQSIHEYVTTLSYNSYGGDVGGSTDQFFSLLEKNDVAYTGFFDTEGYKALDKEFNLSERYVNQYRVNLSPPFEKNNIHTDSCALTLLYYCNMDWKIEYSGHTIFMDDHIEEPIYTSIYTPGKLIVFDGNIPHMILSPISSLAGLRKTFVIQYGEKVEG